MEDGQSGRRGAIVMLSAAEEFRNECAIAGICRIRLKVAYFAALLSQCFLLFLLHRINDNALREVSAALLFIFQLPLKCRFELTLCISLCSNPSPVNNGQACVGESVQVSDCSVICTPINGQWTSWSSWSTCSHECAQVSSQLIE